MTAAIILGLITYLIMERPVLFFLVLMPIGIIQLINMIAKLKTAR